MKDYEIKFATNILRSLMKIYGERPYLPDIIEDLIDQYERLTGTRDLPDISQEAIDEVRRRRTSE